MGLRDMATWRGKLLLHTPHLYMDGSLSWLAYQQRLPIAIALATPLFFVAVQGVYRCKLIMLAIELTNDWLSAVCEVS